MTNGEQKTKSGAMGRLLVIFCVFGVLAGGIWVLPRYLESKIPKPDEQFLKERAQGLPEPDPEQSGLEIVSEMFGAAKPSKEVEELKKMKAEDVVFTYDAIMKMNSKELDENIEDLAKRLEEKRSSLPPSFGAGAMGAPKDSEGGGKKNETIASLALPLEVMRQVKENKN